MGLEKYTEKRNFRTTSEPEGKKVESTSYLAFVVQKHAASRLHYDFRLEFEGVLKSWAIPKGPSMNPNEKRLAVMVEDHPYEYKDFEGHISEGNYGAGNVIVWDNGFYTTMDGGEKEEIIKNIGAGLLKGHLAIRLEGKKLHGEFDLVRLKGKDDNAWLLIKKKDSYADTEKDILEEDKSVLSNTTLEELEKLSPKRKAEGTKRSKPSKKPEPESVEFHEPMLAEKVKKPFDNKDWIFEVKYDGYRIEAVITQQAVNLFSRNRISYTSKFGTIIDDLRKIQHSAVLDGEVVIEDSNGRSDFQLLQNYQKTGKGTLKYYVFDLLNLDGKDITQLKLVERKELLKMLLEKYTFEHVFYAGHVPEHGVSYFELAESNNWEGIMGKKADSPYRTGKRSGEWLKIKRTLEEEAIILGITEPKGSRMHFGAILLGKYTGGTLKYVGNCGTGFAAQDLKDLYTLFEPSFTSTAPVSEKIIASDKVQWMKPAFVAQVKYTEVTQDGHLRHPVFLGLRDDKTIRDLKKEDGGLQDSEGKDDKSQESKDPAGKTTASKKEVQANLELMNDKTTTKKEPGSPDKNSSAGSPKNNVDIHVGEVTLHLTNRQKLYFPQDNVTKGDLIDYYAEVAGMMVPYLKDRPQSMNRFPNGIRGASFYQKDLDLKSTPSWVKTEKIYSESNNKEIDYLICNDTPTLLYMANLGCIEINPWNSTIHHPDKPDWMVIDLDPETTDFKQVVRTALTVRKVLEELDTEGYCKTSGATGLHIYIPLAARYEYESVRLFGQLVAEKVHALLPEITTVNRSLQKREHKIYIDYLQNSRGQTLAAPYSVRPMPGATVSTPLEWDEVTDKLSPSMFTVRNALQRFEKKGDLWKPVLGDGADIERIVIKHSKLEHH
jgi:bifunctional non-homologous end joining protein LigD